MKRIGRTPVLAAAMLGAFGIAAAGAATLEEIQAPPSVPSLGIGPPSTTTPLPSMETGPPSLDTPLPAMDGLPPLKTPLPPAETPPADTKPAEPPPAPAEAIPPG